MWKTSEFDGSLRLFETVGLLLSQMTKFLDCLNGQVQCRKAEILIKLKRQEKYIKFVFSYNSVVTLIAFQTLSSFE